LEALVVPKRTTDATYEAWRAEDTLITFNRLLAALRRHATAVCIKLMGYAPDDLLGDIVSKALLKQATHFNGRSRFSTWFHRLALNTAYDYVRKQRQRRERSFEGLGERDFLRLVAPLEDALERRLLLEKLRAELPPDEYDLVRRLAEGESLKEIARACHLKFRTLQTRWRRLKLRLRSAMTASTSTE
jgi:RNA polymerase sigma factor (sigma-70 family)